MTEPIERPISEFPDRDEPPGLYVHATPLDTQYARQLTGHLIESTAIHSKSRGWIPSVSLKLEHVPLVGSGDKVTTQLLLEFDTLTELIERLCDGLDAAMKDAEYGPREGPRR